MPEKKHKIKKFEEPGFIERKIDRFFGSMKNGRRRQFYSWERKVAQMRRQKIVKHGNLIRIRYGNLALVILGLVAGGWLLYRPELVTSIVRNESLGYIGSFITGFFYTYGVTNPAATVGFYIVGKTLNPFVIALVGAVGAAISNFLVFYFIKNKVLELVDSFTRRFNFSIYLLAHKVHRSLFLRNFVPIVAGLIIASPVPSEIAIGLFAAMKFHLKKFMVYAFVFQFLAIFLISYLGATYRLF